MREKLKTAIKKTVTRMLKNSGESKIPNINLVIPDNEEHGDYATNIAMQLTKILKSNPKNIAEEIVDDILFKFPNKITAEIVSPGFINFKISKSWFHQTLKNIVKDKKYFTNKIGKGKKVLVEFVSANPTGPLHIGHGRGAAYGDSLCRVLGASGYKVTREYYINDAGNQMNNLGKSIYERMLELEGKPFEFPEDGYHGDYIIEIAKEILKKEPKILTLPKEKGLEIALNTGIKNISSNIKNDLKNFRIEFDNWFSEKSLYKNKSIEKTIKILDKNGYIYEKDKALWFSTAKLGDDKNRVLKKSQGGYTYFAPDIAYHRDKYKRGYDLLVDIWGADHHGYINRMKCAVEALGYNSKTFEPLLIQMVSLVKNGKKINMSTRAGSFIPLSWLIEEVGVDAARFFYNMRSYDSQFEFDIDLAKSKHSDNPVYYIQYAHARIYSLLLNAKEKGHKFCEGEGLKELVGYDEINIIKLMIKLKHIIELSAIHFEPHRIAYHLQDLATAFHKYYYSNKIINLKNIALTNGRLTLCKAVANSIKYGLDILGVSAPERM